MAAITNYPPFEQPDSNSYIWRYLSLTFFLDFLVSRELHFSRLDQFDDKFEASLGKQNYDKKYVKSILENLETEWRPRWLKGRDNMLQTIKEEMYVNCWHLNEVESMAMWKIYSRLDNAIAIKCRYGDMVESLSANCRIGKVTYFDYNNNEVPLQNIFFPIMHKRSEYSFENEVRIVHWPQETRDQKYMRIQVEPEKIINQVYLSPGSPGNFKELLNNIISKYGYTFTIVESDLLNVSPPKYSGMSF